MSSLAATQADGYYRPGDAEYYDGKKTLKQLTGAKGHNQYLQKGVIRFELPYNCWCTKCNTPIGKGVRFNATKVEAGKYFSTKIWEFHMKCPSCKCSMVIRTDPKNCDYDFVEGIRRREQEFDPEEIGLLAPSKEPSAATAVSMDPLVALEKTKEEKRKTNAAAARLQELMDASSRLEADTYGVNSLMRNKFRKEKKEVQALEDESLAKGLRFRLLAPSEEDAAKASIGIMGNREEGGIHQARRDNFKKDAKSKFSAIMSSSIFAATDGAHGGGAAGSDLKRKEPSSSSSASSSSALMALMKKSAPAGGNKSSKALLTHNAKQSLAIKRAKQGINTSLFSLSKSSISSAAAGGGSALPMPIIRKKKK